MDSLIGVVPDTWQSQPLESCCQLKPGPGGSMLRATDRVAVGGVPVINTRNIDHGRITEPQHGVSDRTAKRLHNYRIASEDILLVRVGSVARHAMAGSAHHGWLMGSSCIRIRAQRNVVPAYLNYYLAHPAVQDWLAQHIGRGVQPTMTVTALTPLPVVLPPLQVQESIVEVAQAIDDKIRVHEEIVRTTRALRDLVLPQLLTGNLTVA